VTKFVPLPQDGLQHTLLPNSPEGKFSQKPEKSGFPETTKTEKRALARYGLIFVLKTGTYRAKPKFSSKKTRNFAPAFLVQKAGGLFLHLPDPGNALPQNAGFWARF